MARSSLMQYVFPVASAPGCPLICASLHFKCTWSKSSSTFSSSKDVIKMPTYVEGLELRLYLLHKMNKKYIHLA